MKKRKKRGGKKRGRKEGRWAVGNFASYCAHRLASCQLPVGCTQPTVNQESLFVYFSLTFHSLFTHFCQDLKNRALDELRHLRLLQMVNPSILSESRCPGQPVADMFHHQFMSKL